MQERAAAWDRSIEQEEARSAANATYFHDTSEPGTLDHPTGPSLLDLRWP